MTTPTTAGGHALNALFKPQHIAVIGASSNPQKLGYAVVRNLLSCGFPGRVSPINPSGGEIAGIACFPSLAALSCRADCAIVVVPYGAALAAVRDCAEAGVKAVVLPVTGFAETDTAEGRQRQATLTDIARQTGVRILGPNTNGFYNAVDRVSLGYNSTHAQVLKPGVISIASHSGAMFGGVARTLDRLGFGISKFIAVGNEADLNMMDFLDYLIADPSTQVIGLIIEAIADGRRLRSLAAEAARVNKPIVAVKVGRSEAGIGAALAHSSRLSGSARAYDALFQATGIASVGSVEALAGGCAVLATRTPGAVRADQKLICITSSGAGGALLADAAAERKLPLAGTTNGEWPSAVADQLRPLGLSGRIRNPIDLGVVSSDWKTAVTDIYRVLEGVGATGPTVVYTHIPASQGQDFQILDALVARRQRTASPIAVVAPGGLSPAAEDAYARERMPLFHDTATCLDSLACHYATLPRPATGSVLAEAAASDRPAWIKTLIGDRFLSEVESARVLRQFGIPMVESHLSDNVADAQTQARTLGGPVVLKVLAPNVTHKSQSGFVALGLDAASLPQAYAEMERKVAAAGYARRDVQFVVQPMLKSSAELIVGANREAGLGHFVLVGLGGVHAELLDKVLLFPVATSRAALTAAIRCSWLGSYLNAVSGARVDTIVDEIAVTLDALQSIVARYGEFIASIDINPLLVTQTGCVAVDALIVG